MGPPNALEASQPVEPVEVVDVLLEPPNGVSTAKHHKTAENVQKCPEMSRKKSEKTKECP